MNTRRGASRRGCSALSSARAAATSGRSCSAACSVFFEGDPMALVEAPHRARCGFLLLLGAKAHADLIERQVGLRRNKIEQPLAERDMDDPFEAPEQRALAELRERASYDLAELLSSPPLEMFLSWGHVEYRAL